MFSPLTYLALIDEYPPGYTKQITLTADELLVLTCILPPALDRWRWQRSLTPDNVWDAVEANTSSIQDKIHRVDP